MKTSPLYLIISVLLVCTVAAALATQTNAPVKDPFASGTPRKPCEMRSTHDLVRQEMYGIPAPQPQNPSYCQQPVCQGTHRGELVVRYDNTKLLRTGSATLDIATDDGSPLGTISIGPLDNIGVQPLGSLYSPDASARFTLTGKGDPVGPNDSYGDGPFDESKRQLTYPLSMDIQAWCGQHTYHAKIVEKLKIHDLISGRIYTP